MTDITEKTPAVYTAGVFACCVLDTAADLYYN